MERRQDATESAKAGWEHIIHGFTKIGSSPEIIFEAGNGIMLRDTQGKEYMDLTAGVMNVNVGHGRKELGEAAMSQMVKLAYTPAMRGMTHTAVIE